MKKIFLILFFFIISKQVYSDPKMDLGLNIFNNTAQCSTCHVLKAANSNGALGPNLDEIRPIKEQVINSVKNGIGVMPSFEGILTEEEIEAVSYFVSESAGK